MKKYLGFVAVSVFLLSCADDTRDNPYDERAVNYIWRASAEGSSSSVEAGDYPSSSSVVYSSSSSVQCSNAGNGDFIDTRDGKIYGYVTICSQTWMAKNLNYKADGSRCYGDNSGDDSEGYCDTYGRLYNWSTAMNFSPNCNSSTCSGQIGSPHRGICPYGWHIPSSDDLRILEDYIGDFSTAGKHLKSANGWEFYSGIENLDTYGFSALPGGYGFSDGGGFDQVGYFGVWWTASEYDSYGAYAYAVYSLYEEVGWGEEDEKSILFSVRCIQNR